MATRVKQEHWLVTLLLAVIWPLKVISVYFIDCFREVSDEVVKEWKSRKRYTGWER